MADISLPIRCCSSDIRWDGDNRYPLTIRCYGFEPKISPPTLYRSQTAVRALTALREVQYHRNQRFLARKKTVEGIAVDNSSELTVAEGSGVMQVRKPGSG